MNSRAYISIGAIAAVGIVSGLWWIAADSNAPAPPAARPGTVQENAGTVPGDLRVDGKQAAQLGIRLAPAVAVEDTPLVTVPAVIQPPANARVAVAATFPGVVMRTLVVEGDTVRQGQALAVISSREVLMMGADLTRANARLGVARSNAARLSQLSREGIIAGARADEASAMAVETGADVSEKTRILRMVNGHGASGTYTLTAPIAGRVTTASIQAGGSVDGTTAPYVIDAANRYEVLGQLPERLVGLIRPGMTVRIDPDIKGRVTAVGSTIDPATRSASVKAEIAAGPGIVAGRATNLSIAGPAPAGAVGVPAAALATVDNRTVVFVATTGGFAMRDVKIGGTGGGQAVLLSGVKPGEQVVIAGTSALKALALSR
ncbi:MAG: efflux RND transporter periplasmic adaptor subunit [Sphingobium sp.]|jgi:cobalt-zinc-cadmium efflux system membrane fusion protein|uniref:efflux RND transporter periplasmic adaptor subunit n=1 Tax=Sphingobium sp. (strain NBRC 103272 / SYK-6) TaxID=627192 RepID=UPI0002277269|nr:efflux RND transporter periplasmic adaptor subunit [Sphingobium sp. SYK-6]MPT46791.1 efflux RND transporter periplasmic adaptor subunit [Sphingobium sp.]BAK67592.1 heavy metal efflux system protein [Sphingobium sp. SYK-6]